MTSRPSDGEGIKRRLAELIVRNLRLAPDRIDAVHEAIDLQLIQSGEMFVSWSLTGHGYSIDADSIDEVAEMFAAEYRAERVEIPSFKGVDPEKTWMEYVEETRSSG